MWLRAQYGRLCAWDQAKALALREASHERHGRTQLAEAVGEARSLILSKLQAKRTAPPRSRPGAIGSRGRIAMCGFIGADKL